MPRPPKDPNAEKKPDRQVFREAAVKRTGSAVKAIANVAKLPRKGRKDGDIKVLIDALRKAVDTAEAHLTAGEPDAVVSLPD